MLTDCSTRTTAVPSALMRLTISRSSLTIFGARPSDSSSMSKSRGLSTNALPSPSICCSPPDSVPATTSRRSASRGNASNVASMPASTALRSRPCVNPNRRRFSSTESDRELRPRRRQLAHFLFLDDAVDELIEVTSDHRSRRPEDERREDSGERQRCDRVRKPEAAVDALEENQTAEPADGGDGDADQRRRVWSHPRRHDREHGDCEERVENAEGRDGERERDRHHCEHG